MEAQKAIDAKLVELLQEIRELKTQRNTHAPISKLPNEVLLETFMVMMTSFPVEKWHQVAHVCRRWRNVAVGAPMLWTNPPTYRHHFTVLMLERSNDAGLNIHLHANTPTQTAEAVLNCIGRIESLALEPGNEDDDDEEIPNDFLLQEVLLPAMTQDASRLKSLKVTCSADESWDSEAMLQLLHPLNRLNELRLTNVLFDWNVLPLNNLTHLSFQYISLPVLISMQQFIETLRQMPRLERLGLPLSDNVLSPHIVPATTDARLTLSFLRLLELRDSHAGHLAYFFAHTAFPRLRRLDIEIGDPRGYTDFINNYYSTIIQPIASTVINGDFGTFEQAAFGYCSFRLSMLDSKGDSPDIELNMPLIWDREEEPDIGTRLMLDISELCRPNFSKLLHLRMDGVLTEEEYMRLFGGPCLSYLQKITIHHSNIMRKLTSVLAVPVHRPAELAAIPFPNVKSISCDCVPFTDNSVLDAFTDCLMLRRECGYPLQELALLDCFNVTPTQLTRLKQAVVNLTCTQTQI